MLASERAALLSERATLSARLAEAEAAAAASREEAAALRRLQLELQSRHPEVTRAVEAAVRREQALQDDRNRKVRRGMCMWPNWEADSVNAGGCTVP